MTTIVEERAAAPVPAPAVAGTEAGTVATTVAATGLAVAGAVHFALLPHHAEDWLTEGIIFGLVGALQLGLAAVVLARPRRSAMVAAMPLALGPAVIWFWRVRWGLPVGPESGVAEAADFVGRFTAGVEVAAFVALLIGFVRPRGSSALHHAGRRMLAGGSVTLVALMGSGVLLATPLAAHTHDEGAGGHSHSHGPVVEKPMTEAQRARLGTQLATVQALALRYPTAADAEEAGYMQTGPLASGSGAHYINTSMANQKDLDLSKPLAFLYSDTRPNAPIVGVMYYSTAKEAPAGFVGPNDVWHKHGGACYRKASNGRIVVPLAVDADVTRQMCADAKGTFIDRTGWMIHVWVVPGWESSQGVFSHDNQAILCPSGTKETGNLATGCQPT